MIVKLKMVFSKPLLLWWKVLSPPPKALERPADLSWSIIRIIRIIDMAICKIFMIVSFMFIAIFG